MGNTIIAPSVLAADFGNLQSEIEKINNSNAEWVHFDVMDGNFVPNISFGFPILSTVRKHTDKFIDVHLMIENPSKYFEEFKAKGADGLTIHYEGNNSLHEDLQAISSLGLKAALVINPDTKVEVIEEFTDEIDMVLLMSVFPGFGGQKFIEETFGKVSKAREIINKSGRDIKIQVDGGVSIHNSKRLIEAGADSLVSGSALFKSDDFNAYVNQMKGNV